MFGEYRVFHTLSQDRVENPPFGQRADVFYNSIQACTYQIAFRPDSDWERPILNQSAVWNVKALD